MAANRTRANYEELNRIAQQFGGEAENTKRAVQQLSQVMAVLQNGDWVGQGATAFYAEMNSEVLPSLQRLIHALESARGTTTQINAAMEEAEQEAARILRGPEGATGGKGGGWRRLRCRLC